MFVRLDIDAETSICVDHTHVIIEKQKHIVGNKPCFYVGIFAITTVANFDDGVVSSDVSLWKKSSYRQLISSKEFKTSKEADDFYNDVIKRVNEGIRQTFSLTMNTDAITERLDKLLGNTDAQVDTSESLEEKISTQNQLLEKLVVLLTPKEKPPAKPRTKKKDVGNEA